MKKGDTVKLTTSVHDGKSSGPKERELAYFGASDVGNVRGTNEDNFVIIERNGDLVLAVFDGMGGMQKGEVASKMAAEVLARAAQESNAWEDSDWLLSVLKEANQRIFEFSKEIGSEGKVGTTGAIALLKGKVLACANVGDSRVYLHQDGSLRQITEDHTLVADQVAKGLITPEEARVSRLKNVLTKAIGVREEVEPQLYGPFHLEGDEAILLCSDGLYNMVPHETIEKVISQRGLSVKDRVMKLIDLAKKNGGLDNITVILYDPAVLLSDGKAKWKKVALVLIALILLIAVIAVLAARMRLISRFGVGW